MRRLGQDRDIRAYHESSPRFYLQRMPMTPVAVSVAVGITTAAVGAGFSRVGLWQWLMLAGAMLMVAIFAAWLRPRNAALLDGHETPADSPSLAEADRSLSDDAPLRQQPVVLRSWWAWVQLLALLVGFGAVGAAGWINAARGFAADDIGLFTTGHPRLARLELSLDHPLRLITPPSDGFRPSAPRTMTTATAQRVLTRAGWQPASGQVLLRFDEPHPQLQQGDVVRVLCHFERPGPAMNPGQFDWQNYYRNQRILASVKVPSPECVQIIGQRSIGVMEHARAWVRRQLVAGFDAGRAETLALLRALLLGDHDPAMADAYDDFRRSGTSHHLAISGLHVAVLGGVVLAMLRLLRLPPRVCLWASTAFVVVYGLMALPSAPVIRSVLLWTTFSLGFAASRRPNAVQLLALAATLMLLAQPMDLFSPGFQLSFGVVLGLVTLTPLLTERLAGNAARQAIVTNARRRGGLMRAGAWMDQWLLRTVAAALVAWFVAMPLVVWHFEMLNLYAVPGSILLAPLVFLSLVAGLMKIVLTALLPSAAGVWASFAAMPVGWMRDMVGGFASLPWADIPLPQPSIVLVVLVLLLIALAVHRWPRGGVGLVARIAPAGVMALILLLPFAAGANSPQRGALRVTVLAVGAGQCVVVEPPRGRVTVIDCGSLSIRDVKRSVLAPYLRSRGITGIDRLLLSHANTDHYSGAGDAVRAYGTREVNVGAGFVNARAQPAALELLAELRRLGVSPTVVHAGTRLSLGPETYVDVLWPGDENEQLAGENDSSLVLRLTHAGRSMLLPGDIQDRAMLSLAEANVDLRADVLLAAHHGSSEKATPAFLAAVSPGLIVSSNDRTLSLKQIEFGRLLTRTPMLRTHETGAVTLLFHADGRIEATGLLGVEAELPPLPADQRRPQAYEIVRQR